MECCICAEQFTSSGAHVPLLLPCGHSTCKACVHFCTNTMSSTNVPHTFVCAVCKQETRVSQHEVDGGLLTNQGLVGMISAKLHNKRKPVEVDGVLCGCGKNKITAFCSDCQLSYCGDCFVQNHTQPNHHTITQPSNTPSMLCRQHNKNLNGFCNTCNKPVCSLCLAGPCEQHSIVSVAQKFTESKDKATALIAQLAECVHELTQKSVEIQSAAAEDMQQHERMIFSVQQAIAQVRQTLDECEERIVDRIKQIYNAAAKSLQLHSDHIATIAQCALFVSENCNQVVANAKANSTEVFAALASCVAQASSIAAQSIQLCTIRLCTANPNLQVSNQLQHQIAGLRQQIEHQVQFSRVIVDCGNISWDKSKCVARPDGTAELHWGITDESGKAMEHQAVGDAEFQVVMVGAGLSPQPQRQRGQAVAESSESVVYRGREMRCKLNGLECGRPAVFELGVCFRGSCVFAACCGPLTLVIPSLPRFVEVDSIGGAIIGADKLRVVRAGKWDGHRCCFGNEIPRGGVVRWGVRVTTGARSFWVFVGIISQNASGSHSYQSPSSFGWACEGYEYVNGRQRKGFLDWQSGDTATLVLDMESNTLALTHHRTNSTYALNITPNTTWRVHVNLSAIGSAVDLLVG